MSVDHEIVLTEKRRERLDLRHAHDKLWETLPSYEEHAQALLREAQNALAGIRVRRWRPKVCGAACSYDTVNHEYVVHFDVHGDGVAHIKTCDHCGGSGYEPCGECKPECDGARFEHHSCDCGCAACCATGHAGEWVEKRLKVVDEDGGEI